MNLAEKIAQRFILGFNGTEMTPALREWLLELRPGGIILFGRNVVSLEQTADLIGSFHDIAARHGLPPLIMTVDEEGGRVSRLPGSASSLIAPSPMAQAEAGLAAVKECTTATAQLLRSLGYNLNLAPDADINNNPANPVIGTRSYGSDPQQVTQAVLAALEAYEAAGMGSCIKHFPGHGDTTIDSHLSLPTVEHNWQRLESIELVPFKAAIAAGVPAIMTAHIVYPQLEPELPATLSRKWLTDILRNDLQYNGLIMTDALEMNAVSDTYSIPVAAVMAFMAGADMVLTSVSPNTQLNSLRAAIEDATQHAFKFEPAVERILAFKEKYCRAVSQPLTSAQSSQIAAIYAKAARQGMRVTIPEGVEFKPQAWQSPVVVDFNLERASPVEEGREPGRLLQSGLATAWPNLRYHSLAAQATDLNITDALQLVQSSDLTVIVVRNLLTNPAQAKALRELSEAAPKNLVVVAARDPYDLMLVPERAVQVATFGDAACSVTALTEWLLGQNQ